MAFNSEKDDDIREKPEKNGQIDLKIEETVFGRLVFSLSGRDKGRYFIAVGVYDEDHILLADGDLRRMEKPKKKKIRHVKFTRTVLPEIKAKLKEGRPVQNAELRKAIAGCIKETEKPDPCCGSNIDNKEELRV